MSLRVISYSGTEVGAGAAVGAAAGAKKKKRKPQSSPNPNEDPTSSQEEKDDSPTVAAMDISPAEVLAIVPPPPPPRRFALADRRFDLAELEAMHNEIVQKCVPLIDGINALNIFGLAWVEHKLKEHKMNFKKKRHIKHSI